MGGAKGAKRKKSSGKTWKIRPAVPEDLDALAAFSVKCGEESEGIDLDVEAVRAGLEPVMKDPSLGQMFVAADRGRVVGCYMVNGSEWSEWRNGRFLWVTNLYILPEYRRRGVRRALFDHARAWAKKQPSVLGLRAYVHRSNQRVLNTTKMTRTPYVVIEDLF